MQLPQLIYCYDAYCGWCYGFGPVVQQIAKEYAGMLPVTVLGGGMILPAKPVHISATAVYIDKAYPHVEALTGIRFGSDYLWHIKNADDSDWYPHSEKPAIALCIFKEIYPHRELEFAADLQYALHFEGRDLTDNEAYRHLLEKYSLQPQMFYAKMASEAYKEKAYYEFALVKQLQVDGYPCVFLQTGELRFVMLAKGYTPYADLKMRLEAALAELQ